MFGARVLRVIDRVRACFRAVDTRSSNADSLCVRLSIVGVARASRPQTRVTRSICASCVWVRVSERATTVLPVRQDSKNADSNSSSTTSFLEDWLQVQWLGCANTRRSTDHALTPRLSVCRQYVFFSTFSPSVLLFAISSHLFSSSAPSLCQPVSFSHLIPLSSSRRAI